MRKTTLIIASIFALIVNSYGQYFADEEISKNDLTAWNVDSIKEYEATYFFGISEGECDLRVIISDGIIVAQTSCYTPDSTTGGLKDTFNTFTNVRIEGNKFYSDQTNGEFMIKKNQYGTVAGLFVYNPWTYKFNNGGEFGPVFPDEEGVYLVGTYPFVSKRILTEQELETYSLDELKIMRNEIFARYGFTFQKGGEMEKYFCEQKWYKGRRYKNVDQWLTEIELQNIETIKKVETQKNK
ncbi:MAG: YARHG domain-containing protein [Bacteroidales bacterium]|jgi:hypothetical protein|nr:YARHG domain-containing protein [Bacteroidales bacterium]